VRCPVCRKEVDKRAFYDHMGSSHGWSLAQAERYADDLYIEEHGLGSDTPQVTPISSPVLGEIESRDELEEAQSHDHGSVAGGW